MWFVVVVFDFCLVLLVKIESAIWDLILLFSSAYLKFKVCAILQFCFWSDWLQIWKVRPPQICTQIGRFGLSFISADCIQLSPDSWFS